MNHESDPDGLLKCVQDCGFNAGRLASRRGWPKLAAKLVPPEIPTGETCYAWWSAWQAGYEIEQDITARASVKL